MNAPAARLAACAAGLVLLAGCGSSKPQKVVTVVVTPTPTSHAGAASGSNTASASSSSPVPAPTHLTKLNGTCDTLLPDFAIAQALGSAPLAGVDAFVVGTPEKDIGRVGYLNCRYGVTGTGAAAKPKVEIGISLYETAALAATRISATVDDYAAHGATSSDTAVEGLPARLLTGGVGAGYDMPLLVVASGQRTVAVSVDPSVATGDKIGTDATALAKLALEKTGG